MSWKKLATPCMVAFAAALIVRVLYVASIHDATFFTHLQTEPAHYDAWARAIVAGDAPVHLPFDEAPAYPYFVAIVYAIAGASPLAVAIVQALLGALACAAIAKVAQRLGGARAAWAAGALATCYGPLIYFTGQLEPAALAASVVAFALAATPAGEGDTAEKPGAAATSRWWLAGATWAVAMVVRGELLLAVPFVAGYAWRSSGRRAALRIAAIPAALLAVSLAANTIASGHPTLLTTGAGVNLWLGNNPDADGVNPFVHGRLERVVAEVEAQSDDPVVRDSAFRAHAEYSAALFAKKLAWTFSRRELPNAADIPWQTAHSWVFHPPIFPLGFALVFPLALAGAAAARRRDLLYLCGPIAAAAAACVLFFTNARFRLPMLPPLLVFAGLAFRPWRGRERITLAVALAIGAAIALPSTFGLGSFRVAQIDFNTAALEATDGHLDRAAQYLRAGLARDPDDRAGWIELARVLAAQGDQVGAADAASHAGAPPVR